MKAPLPRRPMFRPFPRGAFRVTSALTCALAWALLATPGIAAAQDGPSDSFRSYLFVLLAFAVGWLVIGAWVFRIGRKMSELSEWMDGDGTS